MDRSGCQAVRSRCRRWFVVSVVSGAALAGTACGGQPTASASRSDAASTVPAESVRSAGATPGATRLVDTVEPAFSRPTAITNPLFPVAKVEQVVQLGDEAGEPLRV
ncbi:MAG: hypothetical protein M3295_01215, partial [Chloroflexota bacterium]|nr:hypothetical protein [Chloroflexota bacterium]